MSLLNLYLRVSRFPRSKGQPPPSMSNESYRKECRGSRFSSPDRIFRARGLTLIELVFVLAIAVTMTAVAVPVIQSALISFRLSAAVQTVTFRNCFDEISGAALRIPVPGRPYRSYAQLPSLERAYNLYRARSRLQQGWQFGTALRFPDYAQCQYDAATQSGWHRAVHSWWRRLCAECADPNAFLCRQNGNRHCIECGLCHDTNTIGIGIQGGLCPDKNRIRIGSE